MGTPAVGGRTASTGFSLSKSKSFHLVFIKLGEYVGGHNISTKIYNQPNPPGTPELWLSNCPKLGFPLSKSKSFHPVFIKLGEYVGGDNISTKFYNPSKSPLGTELWPLNCPKTDLQVEYPASKNVVITIEFTTNTTGVLCVSLALLFYICSTKPQQRIILMSVLWCYREEKVGREFDIRVAWPPAADDQHHPTCAGTSLSWLINFYSKRNLLCV